MDECYTVFIYNSKNEYIGSITRYSIIEAEKDAEIYCETNNLENCRFILEETTDKYMEK